MKSTAFLLITFLSALCFSHAQNSVKVDTKKIILKGIELHDEKKYQEAINEYKKVNKNDSNFVLACVEMIITYIANGQDSLVLGIYDQASVLTTQYSPSLLIYKANALDNLKRSDEAISIYQEGIKKYPLNNSFYYELGVLKLRQEKYKEAHDLFIRSIKCNPYHAASHHQMAILALKQGKLIPAVLAWQFHLLIENSSDKAKSIVRELEKIAKNEYEFKDVIKVSDLSEQDDFSELEALVRSKVALSNKYKSKLNINFNITKQLQLIFEKIEFVKSDKGFYMEFYAPLVYELNKMNYFEPFAYNILSGMNNDEVNSWMKKHKDESEKFANWIINYIGENVTTYETNLNGKQVKARHWYQNRKIQAVGNKDSKGGDIGYWNYYYKNGILRSEGAFNDNNKREGIWKYYNPSGIIQDMENYKNGTLEGITEEYYTNGSLKTQRNYVNGMLDGSKTVYYPTGTKKLVYEFKTGKQEGKESNYYPNGKLKYEVQVINGKYEGPLIQYYSNGHIMEKSTLKEDNRIGKSETYYNYPEKTLKVEANYEKGYLTGAYKSFYRNGKTEEEGTYNKNGEKDGVWKNYYENGNLSSEENYSNSKSVGSTKHFDESGNINEEFVYKNNILQEYKAFDSSGKIIYQNKKDGKNNYDATLYYPNGNKRREGKVLSGKLTGPWKNYNQNGHITSEDNYVEGNKEGKSLTYYDNGKVKVETDYLAGETNGYYRKYHKNGKLNLEGVYIKDNENDEWKTYYDNGNLEAITFYNNGNLDGWQQYFSINGKLDYEVFYELGYVQKRVFYDSTGKIMQQVVFDKGSGELDRKYKNGKTQLKVLYKNNMRQGPRLGFYPDGKPLSIMSYESDKTEGEVKFLYPDGKIQSVQTFQDGDNHGKFIIYNEDGTTEKELNYNYGMKDGRTTYYYPNKKIAREYDYKNDEVHGKSSIYTETGELIIERNYKNDYIQSYSYMDKNGLMLPPIEVKNETGTIKTFYKSGTTAIEYTLKNGALEGKRIIYFANGKVDQEEYYEGNELNGPRKSYYASGKLKEDEHYLNDKKIGKCTYFYENGKIKSEEYFMNGRLHGVCKYFDISGKLTKSFVYYNDELIDEK